MSAAIFLILLTVSFGAYLIWYARESLQIRREKRRYLFCGAIVLAEVKRHFAELKDKQVLFIENKGYGIVDNSKWLREVDSFISLVIIPEITLHIGSPPSKVQTKRYIKDLVLRLVEEDMFPSGFSVERNLEESVKLNTPADDVFHSIFSILSVLFVATGLYIATKQAWIAACLAVLAGAAMSPYHKIGRNIDWLRKFNILHGFAFFAATLSTILYINYISIVFENERSNAAEVELQNQVNNQRLADQALVEAAKKRVAAAEQVKLIFNGSRERILNELRDAIEQERFSDAGVIVENYISITDKVFVDLKNDYEDKSTAYEKRLEEESAERRRQQSYTARIRPYAIDEYTRSQYPSLVSQYRSRLPEIERLRRSAAEQSIDSGKCDYVENVQLSQESGLNSLRFFVDCANENRIYLSEANIKGGEPVRTEAEKAWDERRAISSCREMIKKNVAIPSSVDFHSISGTHSTSNKTTGVVQVSINFDAKNVYGTEIGYTAQCVFEPMRNGVIEILLRR